jgi:hypothetical protein
MAANVVRPILQEMTLLERTRVMENEDLEKLVLGCMAIMDALQGKSELAGMQLAGQPRTPNRPGAADQLMDALRTIKTKLNIGMYKIRDQIKALELRGGIGWQRRMIVAAIRAESLEMARKSEGDSTEMEWIGVALWEFIDANSNNPLAVWAQKVTPVRPAEVGNDDFVMGNQVVVAN